VEFRVMSQGELIFFWPSAESRLQRARQVLEIENLYEGRAEREDMKAYSVFADPNTTAKTSRQMFFFAQDRWVQDRSLQAGVMEAFRNLLMHGEYPISVTWVETSPEKIDVNIHPTKSQVKFLDPSLAFRAAQASVRTTLETAPWIKNLPLEAPAAQGVSQATESFAMNFGQNLHFNQSRGGAGDAAFHQTQYRQKPTMSFIQEPMAETPSRSTEGTQEEVREAGVKSWASLQILGQAHLTYIITQSREGLMLIDQHAAHERVLFEKLKASWQVGGLDIQDFLFPITMELTPDQVEALLSQQAGFQKMGLVLEQLGPTTIGVRSAPAIVKESILCDVLEKTATEIAEWGGSYSFEKSLDHICATMACHSAIRAGQSLSKEEMETLLKQMDEYPLSSFCPHGRPVYVEYPLWRLEKDFGRTL
jgi:DNA mismatch repair protein MutL